MQTFALDLDVFSLLYTEVVYIGTIHSNHAQLSKQMLEAGKHVLCEKPMAINWRQGKEVIDLAKKKNLFFGEVGTKHVHVYRKFHPSQ